MHSLEEFYEQNTELFIDLVDIMASIKTITGKYPVAEARRAVPILTLLFYSCYEKEKTEKHLQECSLKLRKSSVEIYTLFLAITIRRVTKFVDSYNYDVIDKAFPDFYKEKHDETINVITEYIESTPTPSKDNVQKLLEYAASCKMIYLGFCNSTKRLDKLKKEAIENEKKEKAQWTTRAVITKIVLPIILLIVLFVFAYFKGLFTSMPQ